MSTNLIVGILTGLCIIGVVILAVFKADALLIQALTGLAGIFAGFLVGNNKTAIAGAFRKQ